MTRSERPSAERLLKKEAAHQLGSAFGRTDFSRIFIFGPPDFFADFVAGFFLLIFVGKSAQKNPPGKSPAESSKIYTTKILRHISADWPGQHQENKHKPSIFQSLPGPSGSCKACSAIQNLSTSDFQSEVGKVFDEIGGELPAKFGGRFSSFFCWGKVSDTKTPPQISPSNFTTWS